MPAFKRAGIAKKTPKFIVRTERPFKSPKSSKLFKALAKGVDTLTKTIETKSGVREVPSQVDLYGWNGNYMVQNHCLLK